MNNIQEAVEKLWKCLTPRNVKSKQLCVQGSVVVYADDLEILLDEHPADDKPISQPVYVKVREGKVGNLRPLDSVAWGQTGVTLYFDDAGILLGVEVLNVD